MLMILRHLSCVVVSCVVVAVVAMGCPAPPSQPDSGTPAPGSAPRAAPELPVLDPEIVEVPRPAVAPPPRPGVIDTGDLPALRARGTLRVLVQGVGEDLLPRAGGGPGREHDLAEALASQLGLRAEFIRVDRFDELIPWLREGKGDIIATRLSVTRSRQEQIAFSRPTATVDEVLVRRIDDESPPRSLSDLAGKKVHVQDSSAYHETLVDLQRNAKDRAAIIVAASENLDDVGLVIAVAKREIPYTVCDSDVLDHALGFVEGVSGDLVVRKKRDIAFGLRKENPQLKVAVDAFVMERVLTAHARELQRVDFEGIQQRGSIRVLTTNDAVSYFLHKGQQRGFDYELIRLFAKKHGLRVDVIVPPSSAELVPWLLQGRGDVIAAMMPPDVPPHPELAFSPPYLLVEEVLIQSSREQRVMSVEQLRGRKIEVPGASAFWRTLNGLQKTAGPFILVTAPAGVEPPELVEKVAEGAALSTVVSVPWSKAALSGRFDVMATLAIGSHEAAFATRADAPKLQQKLSDFVKQHVHKRPDGRIAGSAEYNVLRTTYLEDTRRFDAARIALATPDRISKYDDVIKKYANMYGIDWRLMAAQSYQESGFDPSARSWVGAVGLFQVMPATGAEMGFSDLKDPEQGVHAGIKYMAKLIDSFEKEVAFKQRVRFALAAYNAGRGHVEDARDLAASMKLDRNKWFGNVERAMLLLEMPRYFRKSRYGYCRGSEPVKYVSEIQSLYDNFTSVVAAPGAAVAP